MMYTRMIRLLPVSVLAFVSGCGSTSGDDLTAEARARLISTYYARDWGRRTVYARKFDPQGAPRVRFNGKSNGRCVPTNEQSMVPVPESEITTSLCASLGAEARVVSGRVVGCVSTSTKTPVGISKYEWNDLSIREVNYEVIDLGAGGQVLDSSGWIPTPGNGCPR